VASILNSLIHDLVSVRPRSRDANRIRAEIEHLLMKQLKKDGLRGIERTIARLNAGGWHLDRVREAGRPQAGYRLWRQSFGNDRRLLEVSVRNSKGVQTTSVQYSAIVRRHWTKRQRERFALHKTFYTFYNDIANRAYKSKPGTRLGPADQLVLLIAELEADVNNGGFRQYLDNKGRRRACAALAALQMIGALRTHAMLAAAHSPQITDLQLEKLDGQFCKSPEDLAVLVMKYISATNEA
jgi:hypothetical protein